jgi:hypothetical protein
MSNILSDEACKCCSVCREFKPLDKFHKTTADSRRRECNVCQNELQQERRALRNSNASVVSWGLANWGRGL